MQKVYISDQIYNSSVCGLRKKPVPIDKNEKDNSLLGLSARQACDGCDHSNWQSCSFELFVKKWYTNKTTWYGNARNHDKNFPLRNKVKFN